MDLPRRDAKPQRTIWLFREKLTKTGAIPTFWYQNHISIDRRFGLIRKWQASDAAAYDGARLREGLLDKTNTVGSVFKSRIRSHAEQKSRMGLVIRTVGIARASVKIGIANIVYNVKRLI